MASDRWSKIKSLYIAARQLQPQHRPAFLQSACEGDEEIRDEVESLLRHGDQADVDEFLQTAKVQLPKPSDSWTGRRVGSYVVGERIGAGGMGEVYRAKDTKLKREVAIKILPDEFSRDPDRILRFQREAEAADRQPRGSFRNAT